MMKGAAIHGTAVGSTLAYTDMVEFIGAHNIKPILGKTFALADTRDAYKAATSGELFGEAVIDVAG